MRSRPFFCFFCIPLLALSGLSHAQSVSRITQVKLYPGSATVERLARVSANSKKLVFNCLPAALDVKSLQVHADADVQIGEISVVTELRNVTVGCTNNALGARIRELEDKKALLAAEDESLGIVHEYLKRYGNASTPQPTTANIGSTVQALQKSSQDALQRKYQIKREQEALDKELAPLRTQSGADQNARVQVVTLTLETRRDADVRLSYQINGPGWTPLYRAMLDSSQKKLRLERQAMVAQNTGEDWSGVQMVLSTGQPNRAVAGRAPKTWRIGVEQDREERAGNFMLAVAEDDEPVRAQRPETREFSLFDPNVMQGTFSTEFSLPQAITVPSNGQRLTLSLGKQELAANVLVRTNPQADPVAYLLAELAWPEGVWPAGPVQLYRDGAFVGSTQWQNTGTPLLELPFGRDDLVRVQAEPEKANQGNGGFMGRAVVRTIERAWVVENRHKVPMAVQIVEAAPVSVNDKITVTSQFAPEPTTRDWNKQPGLMLWSEELEAGRSRRVQANYRLEYPKDLRVVAE